MCDCGSQRVARDKVLRPAFLFSLRHCSHLIHNSINFAITAFTGLPAQTLWLNWLNLFRSFKNKFGRWPKNDRKNKPSLRLMCWLYFYFTFPSSFRKIFVGIMLCISLLEKIKHWWWGRFWLRFRISIFSDLCMAKTALATLCLQLKNRIG